MSKSPKIMTNKGEYLRIPVKTHLVVKEDDIIDVVQKYTEGILEDGDIVFVTEKIVAITQGRAIPIEDIKPSKLAYFFSNFVTKSPYGIGLGMPETMEMALRECGVPRIFLAAFMSAITKPFGKKGVFYDVAGYRARTIDGPTQNTIPPYNNYCVLGPLRPNEVSKEISDVIGQKVCIVDVNDLDGTVLGISDSSMDIKLIIEILKDNPLGQCLEQTPMGIIRKC